MSTGTEAVALPASQSREAVYERAKFGMWLFLFSEILFFMGLFLLYVTYRSKYPAGFHEAGAEMQVFKGTLNTFVLLTSSASIALAITAMKEGRVRRSLGLQGITLALAVTFLVVKYLEWKADFLVGFYPGSPRLLQGDHGALLFCSLYFIMTGIHAFHVIAGTCALGVAAVWSRTGKIGPDRFTVLENAGLFWHLVDVIWIFLWPLLYLIR